nr:MAG TPA: hypothetical protein [Caudoviricetes sp.]
MSMRFYPLDNGDFHGYNKAVRPLDFGKIMDFTRFLREGPLFIVTHVLCDFKCFLIIYEFL